MADKRAIKVETLDRLGASFQESRGITDKLTIEQMIELAKVPTASGDNKLAQLVDGTLTEITAADLEGITKIRDYGCYRNNVLTSVTMPNNITTIGEYAFSRNYYLKNVIFSNTLQEIKRAAFEECGRLTISNLPATLTTIGTSAFYNCIQLTNNLIIPDSVTQIGDSAFLGCWNIRTITIGNGVTYIGYSAFNSWLNLTSVSIGSGITEIGNYAFYTSQSTSNTITFTFLATTPPTISTSTFKSETINKIIVPAGCGEAYKSATNWANFADYIEEATE